MTIKRKLVAVAIVVLNLGALAGVAACTSDADVASDNLSNAADNFEVNRRIVFYNGITGEYMLLIEGFCSLGNDDPPDKWSVTCKVGTGKAAKFYKNFLGRSDNVTFFAQQLDTLGVSTDHYVVNFKPETLIPDLAKR